MTSRTDPRPYSGPLRRRDGMVPFNHYLWPLEGDWHRPPAHLHSRFAFGIVALSNGRWLADGSIDSRQFKTRKAALRSAAALVIWRARNARKWARTYRISEADAQDVIAWVYDVLKQPPKRLRELPKPPRPPATSLLELMERP